MLSTDYTARLRKNALCGQLICDAFPEIRRLYSSATKPVGLSNFCPACREFYLQLIRSLHFNTHYLKFFIAFTRSSRQWHLSSFFWMEVSWFTSTPDLYLGCTCFEFRESYWIYRGAGTSLARPGRKQANVSLRMAWISLGALPCRKRNLMTAHFSILLKSRASLTCFWSCFRPGRAKDLSAPRYWQFFRLFFSVVKQNSWIVPWNMSRLPPYKSLRVLRS